MTRSPLIFIASPVSHTDESVVKERLDASVKFAAWVMDEEEKNVFPAAAVDKSIAPYRQTKKQKEWWDVNMEVFMEPAEACYVLNLDEWEQSGGVALEINCAKRLGKKIYHYIEAGEGYKRL